MNHRERVTFAATFLLTAVVQTGCSTPACPVGTHDIAGNCQPIQGQSMEDGGPDSDETPSKAGSSGSTDANDGGKQTAGTGGFAGAANMSGAGQSGGGVASGSEACSTAGAIRCSTLVQGKREMCMNGSWTSADSCPSGQTCVADATGNPSCVAVAELCRGNAGNAICDMQGSLIVCNPDSTIKSQEACNSPRHCQAGLAMRTCAKCVPSTEFRCTGATLEVCSPDGSSFTNRKDCDTEALCNELVGECTDAVCAPGATACEDNNLITCNADGTAIATTKPCGAGFCDMSGVDCNQCEPGTKKCEGDMVATCDPTGQVFAATACSSGDRCVGMGQCVECATDDDCSDVTQGCKVGVCDTTNRCIAQNAPNGQQCDAAAGPGTCSAGQCNCTPQCSGKECGENGCGGTCPSRCSSAETCVGDRCVECQRDSDCRSRNSADGCRVGVCSNDLCTTRNAPNGSLCTGEPGMCSAGACVCEPSCIPGTCNVDDGCGQQCTCSGGEQCRSNRCVTIVPTFTPCTTETRFSSECGNDREVGHSCFRANPGVVPVCVPNPENGSCPPGLVVFSGSGPCVAGCPFGDNGSACPREVPACQHNPNGTDPVGVCVRT